MQMVHDPSWQLTLADESDPRQARRSKGVHLSHILRDLNITTFKPEYGDEPISPHYATRGFLFENMLSRAFALETCPQTRLNQIELESDGIFMTPDAWVVDTGVLDEYKATDTTMKKLSPDLTPRELVTSFLKHYRTWSWQIMAYLRRLQMLECHLYVFFIRGDYKFGGPRGVETIPKYILRYEQWELEENWRAILNHLETMKRAGRI